MRPFNLGAGSRVDTVRLLLSRVLKGHGHKPGLSKQLFGKLIRQGAGIYGIKFGSLYKEELGSWRLIVTRDNLTEYALGNIPAAAPKDVAPPIPPPVEAGEPTLADGDYAELDDGSGFMCLHCEATRKTEKGMIGHVDKEHG